MSIKKDLLAEIEKKAQKIRNKRVEAASNKSLEDAVFDFFRNIEDSRRLHNGESYNSKLFYEAKQALANRIKGFDPGAKISVEWSKIQDPTSWEAQTVRGVTVWWSKAYIAVNNVDSSYFIDINQMLFV